MLRNWAALLHN